MTEYTETELQQKYDDFIKYIKDHFTGDRLKKLLKLYHEDEFGTRLTLAPASGKEHFHLAHCGGYISHIMNVCKAAGGVKKLWLGMGGTIDFTDEEMIFSCLHHDLGKLGDVKGHEYYLPNESEWHRKNKGMIFEINGKLQYMDVAERALYILQAYEIKISEREWLSIRLADGCYSEANKQYLISYNKSHQLHSNLPYIVHEADFISCRTEYDQWNAQQ